MAKLEQAAERENKLKLELKSLNRDRESEREDLESRVRKLVEEKKQLGDIMKEKMEENRWLGEQVSDGQMDRWTDGLTTLNSRLASKHQYQTPNTAPHPNL